MTREPHEPDHPHPRAPAAAVPPGPQQHQQPQPQRPSEPHNRRRPESSRRLPEVNAPSGSSGQGSGNSATTTTARRRRPSSGVRGRLGPYVLERLLGRGGMGNVYLGRHRVLEVHHAVKVLSSGLAHIPAIVQRFAREARSAFRLRHPHIVQVHGADSYQGTRYIAMEYVEGRTLAELVHHGPLSASQSVWYLYQVALALGYAHRQGVVHRDIKPDNVLVDSQGIAKLTDFGLVRRIDPTSLEPALTHNGVMIGTPDFMAPEQWHAEAVDGRADIFSFGVLAYAMLCKRLPFPGANPALVYRRQQRGGPEPMPAGIDASLRKIVLRCLQIDPQRRYQTADEVADELAAWWQMHLPPTGPALPALCETHTQSTQTDRLLVPGAPSALASNSSSSRRIVPMATSTEAGTEQAEESPGSIAGWDPTEPTPTPQQLASSRRLRAVTENARTESGGGCEDGNDESDDDRAAPAPRGRWRWVLYTLLAIATAAAYAGAHWLG